MNLLRIKFSLALCFVFYALSAQFSFDTSNIYSQFKKWDNYFDGKKKINSKSEELIQEGGIYDQYMHERMFWEPRLFPHGSMNVYAKQMKTYHTLYPNNNSIKKGAKLSQGTLSPSLMSLPGQWRELGPNTPPSPNSSGPIYNPQSLGIGPVEFIRLSPFNNGELLCGSTTGGLFYSANNGDNWANAGTDTQWIQSGCKNAAFDANFVNNWVAVSSGQAENGSTNIRYTGGVYRTLDKGTSWTKIADYNNLGGINTILNKVILPKSLSKKAFVATSIGLYKTDDYTLASPTWTQIITNANVYDIEFEESSGRLYAALTPNGLYPKVWYSTNAGAGFTALPDPVFTDGVSACYLMNIELSNAAQGKIFCLYVRPKDEYGNKEYSKEICSYNFSTNLWDVTILTDGLNSLKADLRYSQGEGFAVDQFNANIVYLNNYTGYAIFNIQTITWVNKDDKICNFHPDIEYILSNPFVQNQLWVCTHGGPYKISNSQTFEYKVNGLGVAEALGGDQAESDPSKMAVSLYHDGVLRTTSPYNTSWNPSWGHALNEAVLDGITASISNKHPNIGLTSGQASYEHCWSNDGFISTSTTTNSGEWSSYLKINQHDDNIAYFQSGGGTTIERTFKLTQGPTAFLRETITPSNMISFFNSYNITGVTSTSYRTLRFYMPSNYSNYLYVHILVDQNANSWNDWNKMYLMRTKIADNPSAAAVQNSWEMLPMPVNGWISKLEFDLENPEIVYFFNSTSWPSENNPNIYGNKMMFKVDYSKPYNFATDNHTCPTGNCSDLTFNLPSVTVGYGAFVLEYGTDERIFAATDVGVFVSDRTSRQGPLSGVWTNITDNLPHVPCSNLEVNYDANLLRIMLNGRGVWERALDCPATANLNITTNSADYNAASASLTSSANITGNANLVQYRAGSTVFLTNGFRSNTNFHAYIRPCGNAQSSPGMYMKLANPDVTEKNTETDLEKTFAAYPNPANSYIAVELPDNTTLNYRISDLMGNITSSGQTSSGIIDVSQLANGIYFLLINSNTYRICVIH